MYQLGKQFIVNTDKIMADDKAVVFGDKYRFSVLSDRVIRLEYSEEGKFVDKPTQLIRRIKDMQILILEKTSMFYR